jgi:nucleotide-binding universal stress UspA family protein
MFRKILVPLDTSQLSEIALPYAEEMAAKLDSEVILLHARTSADTEDKPEHKDYLDKIKTALQRSKIKVTTALYGFPTRVNDPAVEILDYADKEKIELIIMATHGRSGIGRWALGSTANKVVRAAQCPLLLIRAGAEAVGRVRLDTILVPLDGSKPSEAVLPNVESLASSFKSQVNLLYVVEPLYHVYPYSEGLGYYGAAGVVRVPYSEEEMKPTRDVAEKYMQDINEKLASKGVRTSYEIRMGSPGGEIIKAGEKMRPDLAAMSTHGQSGFGRFNTGSTADKVLHGGNTPLLLVRPVKK